MKKKGGQKYEYEKVKQKNGRDIFQYWVCNFVKGNKILKKKVFKK